MINLLPSEIKKSYKFARLNVTMRKWLLSMFIVLIGVGLLGTYGLVIIQRSGVSYTTQSKDAQNTLNKDNLVSTKAQVQQISNSLKLSVKVLGSEILFSKLLSDIGAVMPNGTVLTGLDITTVKGGIELTAGSTNYTTATQIQVNLSNPADKIFSKVDIESIECGVSNQGSYPCNVQVRALFNTTNQFLFVNQGSG